MNLHRISLLVSVPLNSLIPAIMGTPKGSPLGNPPILYILILTKAPTSSCPSPQSTKSHSDTRPPSSQLKIANC